MPVRYPITAKLWRMLTIAIAVPRSFPKSHETGPEHVRVDRAEPGSLAHGLHPAVGGTPVQAVAVLANQDGAVPAFADGQIDGAGGARHQGMRAALWPLPTMRRTRWPRSIPKSSILVSHASGTR
jgi:hypothetical protein